MNGKSFLRSPGNESLIYELVSGVLSNPNEKRLQDFCAALKKIMGVDFSSLPLRTSYVTAQDVQSLLIHFLCHPGMDLNCGDNKDSILKWCKKDVSKD